MKNWNLIVCHGLNGEIGKDGKLLWSIPEDMKRFKELTTGGIVIMGRKTWDSLPPKFRPLPNRKNIIVTKRGMSHLEDMMHVARGGSYIATSKDEAISWVDSIHTQYPDMSVWVIGGSQIYEMFADDIRVHYLTIVAEERPDADTYFKGFDEYAAAAIEDWHEYDGVQYGFITSIDSKK